jgi:hypothetical protein
MFRIKMSMNYKQKFKWNSASILSIKPWRFKITNNVNSMSINELLCRQNTDNSIWNARRLHYNLQGNNHLYCYLYCNLINLRLQCVLYHYHNMLCTLSLFSPTGVIGGHGTHCPLNSLPFGSSLPVFLVGFVFLNL